MKDNKVRFIYDSRYPRYDIFFVHGIHESLIEAYVDFMGAWGHVQ